MHIYKLTSEEMYRRHFGTAIGSIHIYYLSSPYARLFTHWALSTTFSRISPHLTWYTKLWLPYCGYVSLWTCHDKSAEAKGVSWWWSYLCGNVWIICAKFWTAIEYVTVYSQKFLVPCNTPRIIRNMLVLYSLNVSDNVGIPFCSAGFSYLFFTSKCEYWVQKTHNAWICWIEGTH